MNALTLAQQLDADLRACCARYDLDEPFVASFTLSTGAADIEYRVGAKNLPDARVLDWRHPLAEAYYVDPGDDFALDAPGYRAVTGTLERRSALTVRQRALQAIETTTASGMERLVAGVDGFAAPAGAAGRLGTGPLADLRAWLTPKQYRLIASSRARPLIIQGRAGSGKTSVALHRVAWLAYPPEDGGQTPIDPARVLIVMYNRALRTFVESMLEPLGLAKARIDTFHGWALADVRKAYNGVIELDTTPSPEANAADALKKHLGMLPAIDALIERQRAFADVYLAEKLAPYQATGATWLARWRASGGPLVRRLITLRDEVQTANKAASGTEAKRLTEVHKIMIAALTRARHYKEDVVRLLTDADLLAEHLTGVERAEIDTLVAFQRSLALRNGSARHPGPFVRFGDLALLLRLIQRKTGGMPDKDKDDEVFLYDHLVLDEAQDFGAVDLAVILGAVRARTGVTIVGDLNQKIVPGADFVGWDTLAAELGVEGLSVARLEVAHRATRPIMALADSLVGDATSGGREGKLPVLVRVESDSLVADTVADAVLDALADDARAHVCVVVPRAGAVDALITTLGERLAGLAPVRKGHNKDFTFAPGVTVTNLLQIKGLEFDAVIVVGADEVGYPDTAQGRRNLYTVITRARDRLTFVNTNPPCAMLAGAIQAGLVETAGEDEVPSADVGDLDEPF